MSSTTTLFYRLIAASAAVIRRREQTSFATCRIRMKCCGLGNWRAARRGAARGASLLPFICLSVSLRGCLRPRSLPSTGRRRRCNITAHLSRPARRHFVAVGPSEILCCCIADDNCTQHSTTSSSSSSSCRSTPASASSFRVSGAATRLD